MAIKNKSEKIMNGEGKTTRHFIKSLDAFLLKTLDEYAPDLDIEYCNQLAQLVRTLQQIDDWKSGRMPSLQGFIDDLKVIHAMDRDHARELSRYIKQ